MHIPRFPALAALLIVLLTWCAEAAVDGYPAAQSLYRQGRLDDALKQLAVVLENNPRDARARFLQGVILNQQNRTDDAIKVFTELTQEYPELPEPYNNLAVIYAAQGNYARAREALEMAVRAYPAYATAHENLGDLYARLAAQEYDKAAQLDKTNSAVRAKRGIIQELLPSAPLAGTSVTGPSTSAPATPATAQATTEQTAAPEAKAADDAPLAAPAEGGAQDAMHAERAQVLKTVEDWAAAWSRGDAAAYLSFYAPEFRPPGGESRAKWENARRQRFAHGRGVSVTTSDATVGFTDANHAAVTFKQDYVSQTLRRSGRKTLHMRRQGERWLITRESIAKA